MIAAAIVEHLCGQEKAQQAALNVPNELLDWSSTSPRPSLTLLEAGDTTTKLTVSPCQQGLYDVEGPDHKWTVSVDKFDEGQLVAHIDGVPLSVHYHWGRDGLLFLRRGASTHQLTNLVRQPPSAQSDAVGGLVSAPMHGKLVDILVRPGDPVSAGTRLAILEAMKMQHEIVAEIDGRISEIFLEAGVQIAARMHGCEQLDHGLYRHHGTEALFCYRDGRRRNLFWRTILRVEPRTSWRPRAQCVPARRLANW